MRDNAQRLASEPFRGLTTDGNVVPDLYPLTSTGVSTEPIRRAALEFREALGPASWQTLTNLPARATNGMRIVLDPKSSPERFYRLGTPTRP